MAAIRQRIEIRRPAAPVWRYITDFERMPEWFFGERRVSVLTPELGVGAERVVMLLTGQSYRERFVAWEGEKAFGFEVLNPPWFVRRWDATVTLDPTPHGVQLTWDIRYAVRFGAAGLIADRCGIAPFLIAILRISLMRLRRRLERG
jgi:hypothetical protein